MTSMTKTMLALGTAVIALAAAPPAAADNDSFIRAIEEQGVSSSGYGALSSGYLMCSQLENGASREAVLAQFGFNEVILNAAQQELCPGTL